MCKYVQKSSGNKCETYKVVNYKERICGAVFKMAPIITLAAMLNVLGPARAATARPFNFITTATLLRASNAANAPIQSF